MKQFIILVCLVLTASASDVCDIKSSLRERIICYCTEFKLADSELTSVYRSIAADYKSSPRFLKKFENSQQLWLESRDATIASLFWDSTAQSRDSLLPQCQCDLITVLTNERVAWLKKYPLKPWQTDPCGKALKPGK